MLITVLATVAGILVVGVGGDLVRSMPQRWERMPTSAENQAPSGPSSDLAELMCTSQGQLPL